MLHDFAEVTGSSSLILALFLVLLGWKALLQDGDELLVIELLELGDRVLVNQSMGSTRRTLEDFEVLLLGGLEEGRVLDGVERLAGKVVDFWISGMRVI